MLVRKPRGDIANIGLPEHCIMVARHVYNKVYRLHKALHKACLTSFSLYKGMYSIDARDVVTQGRLHIVQRQKP